MAKRPELRVVVMSATMDTTPFEAWFRAGGLPVRTLSVSGQPNYPIDSEFLPVGPGENYLDKAVGVALDLHEDPGTAPGGILVFVPVTADTVAGCEKLREACAARGLGCEGADGDVRCLVLYSGVCDEEKEAAIGRSPSESTRHVIFSTNVAESSITVDDLSVVIDSGAVLRVSYDPSADHTVIRREKATRAEILQRIGRVGRRRPGRAVHLYSEDDFRSREAEPAPSISKADLADQLFDMAREGGWERAASEARELLTPATEQQIAAAAATVGFYGLLRAGSKGELSDMGRFVSDIYGKAKTTLRACLALAAANLSMTERQVAEALAVMELGLPFYDDALLEASAEPERCGASDHARAVLTYRKLAKLRSPALPDNRVEELERAASQARLIGEPKAWPWKWLWKKQSGLDVFACGLRARAPRCPPDGEGVRLERCDQFYQALMTGWARWACREGERAFGPGAARAQGSPDVAASAPGDSAMIGDGFIASGGGGRHAASTAIHPADFDSLMRSLAA